MSIKVMAHVWEHSKQKGATLLLLLALADMADENGDCYPSTDYLARKARVDERSAQRTINRLIEEGELIVFEKQGMPGQRGQKTNLYRLVLTTIEAALAIPVPQRGGKSVTTNDKPIKVRKKVVSKVSPLVSPQGVVETPPDPFSDPSVKDQKKKEVVVARDVFFHPVFLEVTNDPTPRTPLPALRIVAPVPSTPAPLELPVIPGDEQRAELIALYQELFPTQLTPGVAANIKDALEEFGFDIVRDSFREAKESKPESFVHWKYIDPIMKRRKAAPPDKPFDHPLWEIYRSYWKQMTSADPIGPDTPYLLKRFSEAVARMEKAGATEADIRALITAKISEERYDYRFDYAATDIVSIITKRKAPRQSAAPGWKPIVVSPASEESMTPEQRAEAVRLGRLQRQQVQRTEAERRRALEGESV